jgi:DNA-binding MarR family transcriptional regulator
MTQISFQNDLNWLIIRASMAAKQGLLKVSEAHDLTFMQGLTLCLLEPEDSIPMSAISGLLTCDPSNVTGIVERLSVGAYIERRESSTDRRVKTIKLTEAGIALRGELLAEVVENGAANLARLTADERDTLKALLLKASTRPEPALKR